MRPQPTTPLDFGELIQLELSAPDGGMPLAWTASDSTMTSLMARGLVVKEDGYRLTTPGHTARRHHYHQGNPTRNPYGPDICPCHGKEY
jgi:hypothetical protein